MERAPADGFWYVETWYVSGVHSGYRVKRRGAQGEEIAEGFPGDRYKPGSFQVALADAERLRDGLNAAMKDQAPVMLAAIDAIVANMPADDSLTADLRRAIEAARKAAVRARPHVKKEG